MDRELNVKPMPLGTSVLLFGGASLVMLAGWRLGMPLLAKLGISKLVSYLLVNMVTLGILFFASLAAYKIEGHRYRRAEFIDRFRLGRLSKTDLLWSLATFIAISVLSVVLIAFMTWLGGVTQLFTYSSMPSNTGFRVLQPNEYWIFAPHALYLFFNIFGEEFLWRGIVLPRQELTHGKYAWMVNGSLWALLHLVIVGLPVISMLPLLYMVPLVVQLRKNTWTGIIVHTMLAGPGFYLTALGIIEL